MPLKESYVIWNNKGGVGKTTLTFHMATQYARRNPGCKVLVVDLCPQANVSMALLSSRDTPGSDHLSALCGKHKTISFYLQRAIKPRERVQPREFLTRVREYNNQMPGNLEVLCGDMHLEFVARQLDHYRSGADLDEHSPWTYATSSVRYFIEGSLENGIEGVTQTPDTNWVVFIDTNPSFSTYTEIALVAARKLIIPINADDFSREAVGSMLDLVYGIRHYEEPQNITACRKYMFSSKADGYGVPKPKIHLLISNRTTIRETRAVKAFRGMAEDCTNILYEAYKQRKDDCFSPRERVDVENIQNFKDQYLFDVQDFHTTAILSLHIGCPLAELSGSVDLFNARVKVDRGLVDNYSRSLNRLVERL